MHGRPCTAPTPFRSSLVLKTPRSCPGFGLRQASPTASCSRPAARPTHARQCSSAQHMATEAAAEPVAAPPPAVGSAAERAARGEAPVKPQYVRSVATRVHVGAVSGGRLPAAAAQATAGGDAQPRAVEGKSKKQAKKVRPCCGGLSQHLLDCKRLGSTQVVTFYLTMLHHFSASPTWPLAGPPAAPVQHCRALHHVCAGQMPVQRLVQARGRSTMSDSGGSLC